MHITHPNETQADNLKSTITNYKSYTTRFNNDSLINDYGVITITSGTRYIQKRLQKESITAGNHSARKSRHARGQRISRGEIVTNVSPFPKGRENGGEDERDASLWNSNEIERQRIFWKRFTVLGNDLPPGSAIFSLVGIRARPSCANSNNGVFETVRDDDKYPIETRSPFRERIILRNQRP